MRRKGRPPAWTDGEREQVLALAAEGRTQRAIAEQVFGDARYRGRVERILKEQTLSPAGGRPASRLAQAEMEETFDASDVTIARELVARYERSLVQSEEVPSLADIERLLRIKRQLEAAETIERMRVLYRERR